MSIVRVADPFEDDGEEAQHLAQNLPLKHPHLDCRRWGQVIKTQVYGCGLGCTWINLLLGAAVFRMDLYWRSMWLSAIWWLFPANALRLVSKIAHGTSLQIIWCRWLPWISKDPESLATAAPANLWFTMCCDAVWQKMGFHKNCESCTKSLAFEYFHVSGARDIVWKQNYTSIDPR